MLSARVDIGAVAALDANLRLRFSPIMLEALDRGVPLTLRFRLDGRLDDTHLSATRQLRLRYMPLAQQYQLLDVQHGSVRNLPSRTQLLAALDSVRLPLDPVWRAMQPGAQLSARVTLDTDSLPGPLRLPALLAADWRLRTPEFAWTAD